MHETIRGNAWLDCSSYVGLWSVEIHVHNGGGECGQDQKSEDFLSRDLPATCLVKFVPTSFRQYISIIAGERGW